MACYVEGEVIQGPEPVRPRNGSPLRIRRVAILSWALAALAVALSADFYLSTGHALVSGVQPCISPEARDMSSSIVVPDNVRSVTPSLQ